MILMPPHRFFFTDSRAKAVLANLSILLLSWASPVSPAIAGEKPAQISISPVIICNAHVFESSLTKKEIKDIFLGKKRKWTSGHEIILTVVYPSKAHDLFVNHYINKTPTQFLTYWKHQVFVGEGRFPKTFSTENEMIDYVKDTDGAIGYIASTPMRDKQLKVISISD